MLVELLLGLQSVSIAGPDLRAPDRLRQTGECPPATGEPGAVIVCGRPDQDRYRLKPLPDLDDSAIPRAEATVFGDTKLATDTEQTSVGGFPSSRIMLRLKLPF